MELAENQGVAGGGAPGQRRVAVLDQRLAGAGQGIEIALLLALRPLRLQREDMPHPRQHRRIDAVGLGEIARRLGEAPRPARVHLAEAPPRPLQCQGQRAVIGAGRLEDQPRRRAELLEPGDQRRVAGDAVGEPRFATPPGASGKRSTSSQSLEMAIPMVIVMLWSPPGLVIRAPGSGMRSGRRSDEGDQTARGPRCPRQATVRPPPLPVTRSTGNGPHTHPRAGKAIRQGRRRPCLRTAGHEGGRAHRSEAKRSAGRPCRIVRRPAA